MLALTLNQPWASLIGIKEIETRSWRPSNHVIGQRIAIHASKGFGEITEEEFCELCISEPFRSALINIWQEGFIPTQANDLHPCDLPRGTIIALATLRGVWSTNNRNHVARLSDQERSFGNYQPGRWMWVFTNIYRLKKPIPAQGRLGLWTWDETQEDL
jgi:hypothetical protein